MANALMIQGTGSSVGKSLLTTALCRILAQDGWRVAPFKSQNMSNNAYVTADGGEISRAQAAQAQACGIEPTVLMNPVLLKPTTAVGAQVIVLGRPVGTMTAREYQAFKPQVQSIIVHALHELMRQTDLLIIEGAGSPAEVNLQAHDLANMWVAKHAGATVLLVGDIDRGGVFAQLVGTMELLPEEQRGLVGGLLINKFRGDLSLLAPGIEWLQARCGRPVMGIIPYLQDVAVAEEDLVSPERHHAQPATGRLRIEVVHLPHIANVTDVDACAREPDVAVRLIERPCDGELPDCVILPGSKSTIADLAFVRARGFDRYLQQALAAGREVVGLCGGFQMLGQQILDPDHVEATVSTAAGLGWLPVITHFANDKLVAQVRGTHMESGQPVAGYEIHMGRMRYEPSTAHVIRFTERGGHPVDEGDGAQAQDGRVWGTHLHGVFDQLEFRRWWLNRLRARRGLPLATTTAATSPASATEDVYDRLAASVRPHLDLEAILHLLRMNRSAMSPLSVSQAFACRSADFSPQPISGREKSGLRGGAKDLGTRQTGS